MKSKSAKKFIPFWMKGKEEGKKGAKKTASSRKKKMK